MTKRAFLFLSIFALGYLSSDISSRYDIQVVTNANAKVAGMSEFQLAGDLDFKRAVEKIVERCSVYRDSISC
jgi:hypothetical protein